MDRDYDDTQRLIELYVQGSLSSDEAAEFEEFFMDQPEILAELEAHRALQQTLPDVLDEPELKCGLARDEPAQDSSRQHEADTGGDWSN